MIKPVTYKTIQESDFFKMVKISSKSANNPDFEQTGYVVELEKDQLLYLPCEDASNIDLCKKIEAILDQEEQFDFVNGLI